MAKVSKRLKALRSSVEANKLYAIDEAIALVKKAAGLQKGSSNPLTNKVGKLTRAQLEEIAKTKEPDLTAADLDAAVRTIAGSARSMGLDVEGVV